jgi:NAD(P)-dependent dehydrogenase (short-subunit alcohol dehydrogenase family)
LPAGSAIGLAGRADDPAHRDHVLDQVAEQFGRLDILVLNAGINPAHGPLRRIDLEAARKILEVNVIAPLAWAQDALERFPTFGSQGAVVAVSSVTGKVPSPGIGMYGVSKAALSHLTRTMAAEFGPGVRVNAVAPGVVKTQFASALYEGREHEVAESYPLKRLGVPDDIAAAVAYLASDDAAWVTGEVLTVDGGLAVAGGTA